MKKDFLLKRRDVLNVVLMACALTGAVIIAGCAEQAAPRNVHSFSNSPKAAEETKPMAAYCAAEPLGPATPEVLPGKASVNDNRMRIYTGSMTLMAENLNSATTDIRQLMENLGGYFELAQSDLLIVRVPAQNFQAFVAGLPKIGTVSDSNIMALDVTDEFCDLKAKIKNLSAVRDRLQKLLDKANSIADAVKIEKELNRVQMEIDLLTSQVERLGRQVAYAKVTIRLKQFKPQQTDSPIGRRIRNFTPAYWVDDLDLESLYR